MSARTGFRIARTSEVFNSDDNLPGGGRGGSIADLEKRPRGRPRTGESSTKGVRIPSSWRRRSPPRWTVSPTPKPSRSEAIRRLIERGWPSELGIVSPEFRSEATRRLIEKGLSIG
jgi:hypothetical protein